MSKKRPVLSLGHKDLGTNLPEQKAAVVKAAPIIADFVEEGWQIVVTHSNAPQVGMTHGALSEFAAYHEGYTPSPLSVCSAMSRGYIGYDLQNGLRSEFPPRGIYECVSTIVTEVTVDPYDEAFYQPLKIIGRSMTKEEAEAEGAKGNHTIKIPGKGYQRVVPAPNPVAIVGIDVIEALLDADQVVVCCGGGGVPVLKQGMTLRGTSAVIEGDLTSGLLARGVDVDVLLILTAVDNMTLNFGAPAEEATSETSIDDTKAYMGAGQFGLKSMLLKVKAAIDFVSVGKSRAAITTSLAKAGQALRGKADTRIS